MNFFDYLIRIRRKGETRECSQQHRRKLWLLMWLRFHCIATIFPIISVTGSVDTVVNDRMRSARFWLRGAEIAKFFDWIVYAATLPRALGLTEYELRIQQTSACLCDADPRQSDGSGRLPAYQKWNHHQHSNQQARSSRQIFVLKHPQDSVQYCPRLSVNHNNC